MPIETLLDQRELLEQLNITTELVQQLTESLRDCYNRRESVEIVAAKVLKISKSKPIDRELCCALDELQLTLEINNCTHLRP